MFIAGSKGVSRAPVVARNPKDGRKKVPGSCTYPKGVCSCITAESSLCPVPSHRNTSLTWRRSLALDGRNAAQVQNCLTRPVRPLGFRSERRASYFVGGQGFMGQDHDPSIVDHNQPPVGQPGLWCQWTPNEDGSAIEWDGNEKFDDPTEWIADLIEHFIVRWGYVVNGEVEWDDEGEFGLIRVVNNVVSET